METETRFDLNAAIQNWQQELAAQPNLTPDVRRELETHLRDTIADLKSRGLNEEEAFWLACRRVGNPDELGEEFEAADPLKTYRKRALWIAVAFLAFDVWLNFANGLCSIIFRSLDQLTVFAYSRILVYLPVAWLAVSVARGRYVSFEKPWNSLFRDRKRFLLLSSIAVLFSTALNVRGVLIANFKTAMKFGLPQMQWTNLQWANFRYIFINPPLLLWPAILIATIYCLLPPPSQKVAS